MDAAVVKVPLFSKLLYMYSHVINIINAGLKKNPNSHPGKVDFPARQVTFHQYLNLFNYGQGPRQIIF